MDRRLDNIVWHKFKYKMLYFYVFNFLYIFLVVKRRGEYMDSMTFIIKVADAISDDGDIRRLGLELGVQIADINRAFYTNWAGGRKTSNGNVMLLQNCGRDGQTIQATFPS